MLTSSERSSVIASGERLRNMPHIEIYTKEDCPFCHKAKELLREKGQKFTELDVEEEPGKLKEMLERSRGRKTVPEIFIDGDLIGGLDELRTLANRGELDRLLGFKEKPKEIKTGLVILRLSAAGKQADDQSRVLEERVYGEEV